MVEPLVQPLQRGWYRIASRRARVRRVHVATLHLLSTRTVKRSVLQYVERLRELQVHISFQQATVHAVECRALCVREQLMELRGPTCLRCRYRARRQRRQPPAVHGHRQVA